MPKNRAVQKPEMAKPVLKTIGRFSVTLFKINGNNVEIRGRSTDFSLLIKLTIARKIVQYQITIADDYPFEDEQDVYWSGEFEYTGAANVKNNLLICNDCQFDLNKLVQYLRVNCPELM